MQDDFDRDLRDARDQAAASSARKKADAALGGYASNTGVPVTPCHGRAPTPEAVWLIAEELGFVGSLQQCAVWTEDIGQGDKAINLVQPIAVAEKPSGGVRNG